MIKAASSAPVVVARVIKPHGLGGEVVLESFTDVEGRMENRSDFLILGSGEPKELQVETRRFFNGRWVLKFAGIDDRDSAETLRGCELAVPADDMGQLPTDSFFIHELIGMKVCLKDGRELGTVRNVLQTGGVDLLEVQNGGEYMVPFAEDICVEVDPGEKRIVIEPPEGLLELNTTNGEKGSKVQGLRGRQ